MTHHPSAASLRLHGARLLFPPVATLLFLVLTEYIARGALSGDTFVQYIFPHAEAYLLAWGLLFLVWMAVDWLTRFAPLATLLSALLGCLPATVDFYILQLRGEPFLPWDLMQVSEAAGVASAAGIHVQKSMVVSGVVVLALTVGSFFLYRGLGLTGGSFWELVLVQCLVLVLSRIIMLPGNAGGAEGSFYLFMGPLFGRHLAVGLVLWRFAAFLEVLLLGGAWSVLRFAQRSAAGHGT